MNDSTNYLRAREREFSVEILRTELLLDEAIKILEQMRIEKARLQTEIARAMLEEAVEYPSVIYR